MGYEEALALATKLGYAESDPTADVEGYDAGRKVAIMASIAFNSNVTFSQVYTEGITHITEEDIRYAKEFGYVIKLIGMTRLTEGGVEVKVHPMLLPEQHPLSTVRDSFNAVFIHGEACDDAMFMGRGAGQLPNRDSAAPEGTVRLSEHHPGNPLQKAAGTGNAGRDLPGTQERHPSGKTETAGLHLKKRAGAVVGRSRLSLSKKVAQSGLF